MKGANMTGFSATHFERVLDVSRVSKSRCSGKMRPSKGPGEKASTAGSTIWPAVRWRISSDAEHVSSPGATPSISIT